MSKNNNMFKYLFSILAFFLFSISAVRSQSSTQKTWQVAEKVKAAVHDSLASAELASFTVRETSRLDISSIATTFGYKLGHQNSSVLGNNNVQVQYIQLQSSDERHDREVRLAIITGIQDESARMGLFELMGTRMSRPINSNAFLLVNRGPGDICFSMPSSLRTKGAETSVVKKIWFIRDNIGVELSCSGDSDLLLIAKAIDQAIQSCPVKESKEDILTSQPSTNNLKK